MRDAIADILGEFQPVLDPNTGELICLDWEYLVAGSYNGYFHCILQLWFQILIKRHIFSSHSASVSSKVSKSRLSMSSTPVTLPHSSNTGTTISLLDRLLQAICPGNSCTLGTITVRFSFQLVPHTPRPLRIRVQATGPWNGPSTSSSPITR